MRRSVNSFQAQPPGSFKLTERGLFAIAPPRLLLPPFAARPDGTHQAGVAQLVEQLICNHQVGGSSPFTGSNISSSLGHLRDAFSILLTPLLTPFLLLLF